MDVSDIVYYLVVIIFVIFGFFNKSKKENRNKQKPQSKGPLTERTMPNLPPVLTKTIQNRKPVASPPPVPKRVEFQSSLDLVTDFEGESSLGAAFHAANEPLPINEGETEARGLHPIVEEIQAAGIGKWRKAVIYSEILNRRF